MNLASSLLLSVKALHDLGPSSLGLYALYQLGLRTGHYHRRLTASLNRLNDLNHRSTIKLHPCLDQLPDRDAIFELLGDKIDQLYMQADEIVSGKVRLFGGQPVYLTLTPPEPLNDWTKYAGGNNRIDDQDIKFTWEPARFGWACTLAMAYHLSGCQRYAEAFWLNTERFLNSNPPYMGPHWSSAQEVAIRIIVLGFATQVFIQSNQATPEQLDIIVKTISIHTQRIPPTLVYARSQNNNHLITEALGLYTASALLPEHPLAHSWHKLGWKWLQYAFQTQIDLNGSFTQHSTNYHRLMLQAALWAFAVHDHSFPNEPIPSEITTRLEASTHWLWKLTDLESGCVPNLGHNDGAYILPLTVCAYYDYRPVIYAAARMFLHSNLVPKGYWSDMSLWLCSPTPSTHTNTRLDFWRGPSNSKDLITQPPNIIQNHKNGSWASIRAANFRSRPAHADQLHLDLWWHGLNLAQDPGTYLYNAPPPWDNSLTSAYVHNTVVVDGREFMLRAGRFLYLDWAQARVISAETDSKDNFESLTAQHYGYRKMGVLHTRKVIACKDGRWEVIDKLDGPVGVIHIARLHWLLPDWEHEIQETRQQNYMVGCEIRIHSPYGWVSLKLQVSSSSKDLHPLQANNVQLIRAGTLLYGSGKVSPINGWISPTYGEKIPALACILEISQSLPIVLKSEWTLPDES
jgi:hypothetical protein